MDILIPNSFFIIYFLYNFLNSSCSIIFQVASKTYICKVVSGFIIRDTAALHSCSVLSLYRYPRSFSINPVIFAYSTYWSIRYFVLKLSFFAFLSILASKCGTFVHILNASILLIMSVSKSLHVCSQSFVRILEFPISKMNWVFYVFITNP